MERGLNEKIVEVRLFFSTFLYLFIHFFLSLCRCARSGPKCTYCPRWDVFDRDDVMSVEHSKHLCVLPLRHPNNDWLMKVIFSYCKFVGLTF